VNHTWTIASWLSVADATKAVAFYKVAFGANELERLEETPGVIVVAQLSIGAAIVWVQRDEELNPAALAGRTPVRMILTVDDPDAVFANALAAGASPIASVHEGHGWRIGRIADPSGHQWEIGKPLEPLVTD
jgi:PhnB protein